MLTAVASALARCWPGRAVVLAERAEALVRATADAAERGDELASLSEALAAAGLHRQAEATAISITSPGCWASRAQALIAVAREMSRAGQQDHADRVYALAESTFGSMNHRLTTRTYRGRIATAMATAGQYDQAEALARTVGAELDVTKALAAVGQHRRAEALAQTITGDGERAEALAAVAEVLAKSGHQARSAEAALQAQAIARSLKPRARFLRAARAAGGFDWELHAKVRAFAAVATALAIAGLPGPAAAMATGAAALVRSLRENDFHFSGELYAQAARALAIAGLYDQAQTLATANPHEWQHAKAQTEVARVLAQAGLHDRAEALARAIVKPGERAAALAALAGDLARAGFHERAGQIANSITDPAARSEALTAMAGALAAAGQPDRSQRLVALALATGSWTPTLSLLPPETLLAMAAMLGVPAAQA